MERFGILSWPTGSRVSVLKDAEKDHAGPCKLQKLEEQHRLQTDGETNMTEMAEVIPAGASPGAEIKPSKKGPIIEQLPEQLPNRPPRRLSQMFVHQC